MKAPTIIRTLTSTSAIILFSTMFMPAVSGCNAPIRPYEIVSFEVYAPYLFGLFIFIAGILLRLKRKKVILGYLSFLTVFFTSWLLYWGFLLHSKLSEAKQEHLKHEFPYLVTFVIWWFCFFQFASLFKKRPYDLYEIFLRLIWLGPLLAISFYFFFIWSSHYYGLDISVSAGLVLMFSGIAEEVHYRFFAEKAIKEKP